MMNREQILAALPVLAREKITIKEWGGVFYVREFTGAERDAWEQAIVENRKNARAITVARCLVTGAGDRVFKDDDAESLAGQPARILTRIADKARELNKLGADDVEIEKGNSEPDQVDSSTST
jgi:hypothetical protein